MMGFQEQSKRSSNNFEINKKVIGKMNDELEGNEIEKFTRLRSKMYICKIDSHDVIKKAKGIKKPVVENKIKV